MKIQKQIQVELVQNKYQRPVDLVQYDTGVQLVVTVTDFEIPSGSTATLYVLKPSGKFVYQETGVTISGNVITVNLENQALTEHGETGYQLRLKNGSDRITTFAGVLNVQKSLADSGAVESSTVIAAFEAKTAEQIAEIQAEADAQIERIQNQFNTFATKNEAANAIKGNLAGAVVFADDVSPVEHNPTVTVHGKNLLKPVNGAAWQCTTAIADDGKITLTNTVTSGVAFARIGTIELKKGRTYVYSRFDSNNIMNVLTWKTGTTTDSWHPVNGVPYTVQNDVVVDVAVYMNDISTVGNTASIYIQIEESETASTEYIPYLDPPTVLVSRYGRNVLNMANSSKSNCTINGNGVQANIDNVYYMELYANYLKSAVQNHDGKAMTFSVANVAADSYIALIIMYTDGTYAQESGTGKSVTLWLDHQGRTVQYVIVRPMAKSEPFTDTTTIIRNLMLEFSDTASDFEAYSGEGYIPAADGTVSGVTSLSPNMTILTDTEGVIVECEYNKDTNKVIEKLTNAVLALGGTV